MNSATHVLSAEEDGYSDRFILTLIVGEPRRIVSRRRTRRNHKTQRYPSYNVTLNVQASMIPSRRVALPELNRGFFDETGQRWSQKLNRNLLSG